MKKRTHHKSINIFKILSPLIISTICITVTNAEQNISFGDITNPTIIGGNGNCPAGFFHDDITGDGYEQNEECWRGIAIKNGNLGIGTKAPKAKLSILGDESGQPGTGRAIIKFRDNSDTVNGWNIGTYGPASQAGEFKFGINRNVKNIDGTKNPYGGNKFIIDAQGNIGINIANPSYQLHVNGGAAATSWTNLSSREYKSDIKKIDKNQQMEMLKKLIKLDLATYKYKKQFGGDNTTKLGFIAEEMPQEVLSKDGKGIDIYELLTFTIGAIKSQQYQIEELKQQINLSNHPASTHKK